MGTCAQGSFITQVNRWAYINRGTISSLKDSLVTVNRCFLQEWRLEISTTWVQDWRPLGDSMRVPVMPNTCQQLLHWSRVNHPARPSRRPSLGRRRRNCCPIWRKFKSPTPSSSSSITTRASAITWLTWTVTSIWMSTRRSRPFHSATTIRIFWPSLTIRTTSRRSSIGQLWACTQTMATRKGSKTACCRSHLLATLRLVDTLYFSFITLQHS